MSHFLTSVTFIKFRATEISRKGFILSRFDHTSALQQFSRTALAIAIATTSSSLLYAEDVAEEILLIKPQQSVPISTGDSADLLKDEGVEFYSAGGIGKLPVIHGMNGDRVKVLIDGSEITSACANHMNPPLSYMDASRIESTMVLSGITPVSSGGDSIAGTISVKSQTPVYSDSDKLLTQGTIGAFYRSNGQHHGEFLNTTIASENLSLNYTGSLDRSATYRDGDGDKVLDTLYRSESHAITLGARGQDQELIIKLTHQEVPY
ncbi:MAG: TonB-dependent receptor, partial [Gammaproteobacteria bacterium]